MEVEGLLQTVNAALAIAVADVCVSLLHSGSQRLSASCRYPLQKMDIPF